MTEFTTWMELNSKKFPTMPKCMRSLGGPRLALIENILPLELIHSIKIDGMQHIVLENLQLKSLLIHLSFP